ncbi:MAG: hypothetical protein M1827_000346 [Pycnora praestabilis]|nr:MAG: hypothetical protein M1827_000346 [Pycnora praestabilis]
MAVIVAQMSSSRLSRKFHTSSTAAESIPLRKHLKNEATKRRSSASPEAQKRGSDKIERRLEKWELTVGVEIHAQLNTEHKLFSNAATSISDPANLHVALFDVAFPGSQPGFQKETLIPALRSAIALKCQVQRSSRFDRKHYSYQDQPAGYQITQYYQPLAKDGYVVLYDYDGIAPEDGKQVIIGIKQVQLEQDTAKSLLQPPSVHLLDFNRVSHPLIEIITLPQIHHPSTAAACVRKIQALLKSVDSIAFGMEMGGLRADMNVSVRLRGEKLAPGLGKDYYGMTGLGQRTEIKNLSSFKAVEDAIVAERDRQIEVLETGGIVEGETRGWTLGSTETRKLRGKEGEIDYRYMPDPDLAPLVISNELVDFVQSDLNTTPDAEISMLVNERIFGLTIKDAKTLVALDDGNRLDFYIDVIREVHILEGLVNDRKGISEIRAQPGNPSPKESSLIETYGKTAANWTLHELGGLITSNGRVWDENPVSSVALAHILYHLTRRRITGRTAKQLLSLIFNGDARSVEAIIEEDNLLLRPMSTAEYVTLAEKLAEENKAMAAQIREKGQTGKIKWFVGQMMRRGGEGRVEADQAERILRDTFQQPRNVEISN